MCTNEKYTKRMSKRLVINRIEKCEENNFGNLLLKNVTEKNKAVQVINNKQINKNVFASKGDSIETVILPIIPDKIPVNKPSIRAIK